jgi:hypothetical protein
MQKNGGQRLSLPCVRCKMDDWNFDKDDKGKGKDKEKEKEKDKGKGKEKDKGKGKEKQVQDDGEDMPRLVNARHEDGRVYVPGPGAALARDEDDQLYIVDPSNQTIMKGTHPDRSWLQDLLIGNSCGEIRKRLARWL